MESIGYKWDNCSVFDLTGKDVEQWLQGQITQNILNLSLNTPVYFCFCNANGNIEGIGISYKTDNSVRVILDHESLSAFNTRLNHLILEDIKIEKINLSVILGFGRPPKEEKVLPLDQSSCGEWISFEILENVALMDELEWKKFCLMNKKPLMGIDIKEKVFPIELGEKFDKLYVNYQKGCYVGQEVLMRLHLQGKPRRQWMIFKTTVPLDGVLDHPMQSKGLEITSCIQDTKDSYICGIYVHRNIYSEKNDVIIFDGNNKKIGVIL